MFDKITKQLLPYHPNKILLFGSQANGNATNQSDIDLCIVVDTSNKRKLLTDLYLSIESEQPIDFLLYTPEEWQRCVKDELSFAYNIMQKGVVLYG